MPTARRTLTVEHLRAHLRAGAFGAGEADLVGVEVELTPLAISRGEVDLGAAREGVDRLWAGLSSGGGSKGPSWQGGTLSREPGGQVEYSGPAARSPGEAARQAARAVRVLCYRARRLGFDLVAVGMHPWGSTEAIGLCIATPRYRAMQLYFDELGTCGRQMMRQTGSVQVNVDFGGPGERRERWELAQRLAPVLAATFANSAVACGRSAPVVGLRGEAWLQLDPGRTGIPRGFLEAPDADPVDQYLRFALAAPVMFVIQRDGLHEVPNPPIAFSEWMKEGLPAGFPEISDWQTHVGTLFPDVRPRGYLEIRSMDAPGTSWLGVPILLASHALRDAGVRRCLLDRLRPFHDELRSLRERAARLGVGDPALKDLSEALFHAVRPHLDGKAGALVDAYAERYVHRGRTPGEELRDRIPEGGVLDPAELLRLERERATVVVRGGVETTAAG